MRILSGGEVAGILVAVFWAILVSFLAVAVSWTSDRSILYFGVAIAVVILALAAYNAVHHRIAHASGHDEPSVEAVPD